MFAVIYASAGCLPDSDAAEFYGSADECEAWIEANADDYVREDVTHDLYGLEIVEVFCTSDDPDNHQGDWCPIHEA